ncbi:Zinc resistance conferring protein [Rhodotorula kratochvilovae]
MTPAPASSTAQRKRQREITLIKRCMGVTGLLMLAQIVIGYNFNVMSLVAESYHMMNDVAAFVVQLYADELGNVDRPHARETTAFSFGFGRVEFLANLVQGTLLLALCLTLALESIQRAYSTETILLPPLVVGIGALTLVWNIVMYNLFEGAHHAHDEHVLAKGGRAAHPLRYRARLAATVSPATLDLAARPSARAQRLTERSLGVGHSHSDSHAHDEHAHAEKGKKKGLGLYLHPENSLAVHAFGDALGTIAIIIDGLASWLFGPKQGKISGVVKTWSGTAFVDPICALIAVYIILSHSFPLVTSSSFALMHAFDPVKSDGIRSTLHGTSWLPQQVSSRFQVKLVDLHIWQLNATSTFATVKLAFQLHDSPHSPAAGDFLLVEEAARRVLAPLVPAANATVEITVDPPFASSLHDHAQDSHHNLSHDSHDSHDDERVPPPPFHRGHAHAHGMMG